MGFEFDGRRAPIRLILRVAGLSSAAWYDTRPRKEASEHLKPGPKVRFSDEQVVSAVKEILREPLFHSEGYKKLKVRLAQQGVFVGKERLRRLLRAHGLLRWSRPGNNGASRTHDGIIITQKPNEMYACDIKEWKCKDGKFYMFSVIDHFNDEIISHLTTLQATNAEATQVLRMALKKRFGTLEKDSFKGMELSFRTDHGSQFMCKAFKQEAAFLGLRLSPSFVRSPQSNGIIERYHRTIKEQLYYKLKTCSFDDACKLIEQFVKDYNQHWLIHRLKLKSPIEYRLAYEAKHGLGTLV